MDFPRRQRPVGRRVLGNCGNRSLEGKGLNLTVGGDRVELEEFKENWGGIGNGGGAGMGGEVKELLLMGHFEEPPAVLEIGEDSEGVEEDLEEISLEETFEQNMSGVSLEEIEIENFDDVNIEEVLAEKEGPEDGPGEGMKDKDTEEINIAEEMQEFNGNVGNGEGIGEGGENPVEEKQGNAEEDDDGMSKLGLAILDQFQVHGDNSPPPVLEAEVTHEETKEDKNKNKCWICHRQFINPGVLASHVKFSHPQNFVKSLKKQSFKTEENSKQKEEAGVLGDHVNVKQSETSSKRNPVPTSKLVQITKAKMSCPLCPRLFGNRGALGNHMKICHSEPEKNSEVIEAHPPPSPNPPKESDKKDTDLNFRCVRCPFKTNTFTGLYQHVKMNHNVVCGFCKRFI